MTTGLPELIREPPAFAQLIRELRSEAVVGIDTEAASFHRYHDRIYLLQISSPSRTAVIDPIALGGLEALGDLLGDPGVELVFHDADYDLRLLWHEYGLRAQRLFDTRIAAQFLNEPGIGLASLLERRFGIAIDKRFQRADWSARPLSPGMISYAATDTRYLPALRDSLRQDLIQLDRLGWVEEECDLLLGVEWAPPEPPETAFLRLKGARALDGRGLAVLRELYVWREHMASRLDRAPFRIMGNETLLTLATTRPPSLQAFAQVRGLGRELLARHGQDLLAAVERGLGVAERDLPRIERRPRPKPDPSYDARLERLRDTRAGVATRFNLPIGVLCPNATLEAIARQTPSSLDRLARVDGVRRWQVAAFGEDLIAAVGDVGR